MKLVPATKNAARTELEESVVRANRLWRVMIVNIALDCLFLKLV